MVFRKVKNTKTQSMLHGIDEPPSPPPSSVSEVMSELEWSSVGDHEHDGFNVLVEEIQRDEAHNYLLDETGQGDEVVEQGDEVVEKDCSSEGESDEGESDEDEADEGEPDEGDPDEGETDENEADGLPAKKTTASPKILRATAHGEKTLAAQTEVWKFVDGLAASDEQPVVVLAAAIVMVRKHSDDKGLDPRTVVQGLQLCVVTEEHVKAYCADVGVAPDANLNGLVLRSVASLTMMFAALVELGLVLASGPIKGKGLRMHEVYEVVDMVFWRRLLDTVCGAGRVNACTLCLNVFPTVSTLYETFNILDCGAYLTKDEKAAVKNNKAKASCEKMSSMEKKSSALSRKRFRQSDGQAGKNVHRLTSKRTSTGQNKGKQGVPRGEYKKVPDEMVSEESRRRRLAKQQQMHQAKDAKADTDVEMATAVTNQTNKRKRVKTTAQKERRRELELKRKELAKDKAPRAVFADKRSNVVQPHRVKRVARESSPTPVMPHDEPNPMQDPCMPPPPPTRPPWP